MNIKSLVGQLRSRSADARESALHHIFKVCAGGGLPAELCAPVRDLFRLGPPWPPTLVLAICGCPYPPDQGHS